MDKKTLMIISLITVLALSLCGCGRSGAITSTSTTSQTYPIEPLILYENAPATYEELPKITPAELKALLDGGVDVVVVNVDPLSTYNSGHIPGAVHLTWNINGITEDPGLSKSILVVFYCVCKHEELSGAMGLSAVTKYGYRNIKLLQGGTQAWKDAGYAIEAGN